MRAALYLRVSTREQSPESQRQALLEYVAARGWTVAEEHVDLGVSGKARRRYALDELMDGARARRFDVVLVWRFDRFARSLSHLVLALEEFEALGVAFCSVNDPVDTTTPAGRAMFQIIGAFAELERSILRERVTAGLAAARRAGVAIGRPPLLTNTQAERAVEEHGGIRPAARALGLSVGTVQRALRRCIETPSATTPKNGGSTVPQMPLFSGVET